MIFKSPTIFLTDFVFDNFFRNTEIIAQNIGKRLNFFKIQNLLFAAVPPDMRKGLPFRKDLQLSARLCLAPFDSININRQRLFFERLSVPDSCA